MPDWSRAIRARLKSLNLAGAREREIEEELADHLDDRYRELLAAGESSRAALRTVLEELESRNILAEELQSTRLARAREADGMGSDGGGNLMSGIGHDFKVAARGIRLNPGFSAAVIGILTLGIAGNTAIFSIFDGLFLRPLPFAEPARLIDLDETAPKWDLHYVGIRALDFYAWQTHNSTFDGVAAFDIRGANLSDSSGGAQRAQSGQVTYNLLDVLGLKPAAGRNFRPEEDRPGTGNVAMLSYSLWQRLYGGDRGVLGSILKLNEKPYTIVGVLPKEAAVLPADADVWIPLAVDRNAKGAFYLSGVGRLKRGVTPAQALADLMRVHKSQVSQGQSVNADTAPILTPLRDRYLGDFQTAARILLGGVAVVLLIACVNIAGLMMVRGEARTREIAVRVAVGASHARVMRQLFTESLLLATIGGAAGVVFGKVLLRGLVTLMGDNVPKWVIFDLDWRFAVFSVALVGAAALLFGLAPALEAARVETRASLQEASRSTMTRGRRLVLSGLVAGEIALAVVLLAGAGLLLQAFRNVQHTDPGFRAGNTLTWSLRLATVKYPKPEQDAAFYQALLDRLRSLPGVNAAAGATILPLSGHTGNFFVPEGAPPLGPNEKTPVVLTIQSTMGYFGAMGIRFIAGRDFDETEQQGPKFNHAAIVNELFVKQFFPKVKNAADAVGKRIKFAGLPATVKDPWMTIVGVTYDTKHYGIDQEMKPSVFTPFGADPWEQLSIVLRTSVEPHTLTGAARDAIRQLDPDLPMYQVRTMTERLDRSLWVRRAYSWLFGAFAAVAILLAAAGIYGVIAFAVSRRTRELGIRMALGASPRQVTLATLRNGMTLVAIGSAAGLAAALPATTLLGGMLFGVSHRDLATYAAVVALVALVGLAANYVPARRASRIDPMRALRFE